MVVTESVTMAITFDLYGGNRIGHYGHYIWGLDSHGPGFKPRTWKWMCQYQLAHHDVVPWADRPSKKKYVWLSNPELWLCGQIRSESHFSSAVYRWKQHVQGMAPKRLTCCAHYNNPAGRSNIGRYGKRWKEYCNSQWTGRHSSKASDSYSKSVQFESRPRHQLFSLRHIMASHLVWHTALCYVLFPLFLILGAGIAQSV
jgi:hypothetical protein